MDLTATLGLDAARALDPAPFAIGGVTPRLAVRPATREELSEILAACTRDRLAAVPWGGGTGLAHMSPPARYDVAIQMSAFDAIVDYDPEDMTITAECGATLASLAAALAARGQELPIEGGETGARRSAARSRRTARAPGGCASARRAIACSARRSRCPTARSRAPAAAS
jgi:FAD/FMN-containing dehydrogenase